MVDQTEKSMDRIRADQDGAEREDRRISAAKAELLDLLRSITRAWQPAVDVAEDLPERKSAAMLRDWSGCAEARGELAVYSEAPPVKLQAIRMGARTRRVMLEGVRRQLARFVRGTLTIQEDSRWELLLTREGEEDFQRDFRYHPENARLLWDHVTNSRVPSRTAFRPMETSPVQGGMRFDALSRRAGGLARAISGSRRCTAFRRSPLALTGRGGPASDPAEGSRET
jgi:hypothetical protein